MQFLGGFPAIRCSPPSAEKAEVRAAASIRAAEEADGIDNAWFPLEINTPGFPVRLILVEGFMMAEWAKAKENQIYEKGEC